MYLGVSTLWRARAITPPAGSLIPRDLVSSKRPLLSTDDNSLSPLRCTLKTSRRRFESGCSNPKAESPVADDQVWSNTAPKPEAIDSGAFAERLARVPVRPHVAESILVRSRMAYPHSRETDLHEHKLHRELLAQKRHDAVNRAKHEPLPDWRRLLQELLVVTPRYLNGSVRIFLSQRAMAALLDRNAETSLWYIRSRTQCYIELEKERDQDGNAVLKIFGPRSAVEKALDDIVQVSRLVKVLLLVNGVETVIHDELPKGLASNELPVLPSDAELPKEILKMQFDIRPTRVYSSIQPQELTTSAQGVPKPSSWTKESFEQYVATLTRGHMPAWRAYGVYRNPKEHQYAVAKQLIDVFYDPEAQTSLSSEAFKMALEYIARRGRTLRSHARVLFDRMEKQGIPTDTTVFNLLIEATIHDRDLRNFSTCVYLMIQRGHHPNLKTWLLFLRLPQSEEVKRYILQAMNHKGLLASPDTIGRIAFEMAPYDAERAMAHGWDLDTILAEQTKLYGPGWLTWRMARHTCNRMVEVMAKHGKWDQIGQFADFMASHSSGDLYPDAYTLDICIEHGRVQRRIRTTIDLLQKFEDYGIAPDMLSLQSLFKLFRFYKMPHAMDMVWQYSSVTAQTSFSTRHSLRKLLAKGSKLGWNDNDIPMVSDAIPQTSDPKDHALYALLKASSTNMFQLEDPMSEKVLEVLLKSGSILRNAGWVPREQLSKMLRQMVDRDRRFHKGLMEGKWIIEPALLPIEDTGIRHPPDSYRDLIMDQTPNEGKRVAEELERHEDYEI